MNTLPQWDAISESARAQLLQGVVAMLRGDTKGIVADGDVAQWDELLLAGLVQRADETLSLTGVGTYLVLDVLQATGEMEHLVA